MTIRELTDNLVKFDPDTNVYTFCCFIEEMADAECVSEWHDGEQQGIWIGTHPPCLKDQPIGQLG